MPGICFRCKEFVHQAEEKLALGSSWHFECFTCAICNTTLDSTTMSESSKGKEIYCRKCYEKNYSIPGYGFGPTKPTLISITPANGACRNGSSSSAGGVGCPCRSCGRASADGVAQPFVQPPSRQGQEYSPRRPPPRHYTKQVVLPSKTCTCQKSEQDGPSPRVPTYHLSHLPNNEPWKARQGQLPNKDSWKGRQGQQRDKRTSSSPGWNQGRSPTGRYEQRRSAPSPSFAPPIGEECTCCCTPPPEPQLPSSSSCSCCSCVAPAQTELKHRRPASAHPKTPSQNEGASYCQKCGLEVFFAERLMGYRGVYHVRCFVCYNCRKTLDSTTVNEHQGQLYCKGCYKHKYGTVGVGYGVGAGTLQTP